MNCSQARKVLVDRYVNRDAAADDVAEQAKSHSVSCTKCAIKARHVL